MSTTIECIHMNHINACVEDDDASIDHFQRLYDGQMVLDLPRAEWHACLLTIGTVIFEFFAPHQWLLNARYGPHYVGVEYQVRDVEVARTALHQRGLRILRELGTAFHSDPVGLHGVSLECFGESFDAVPPPVEYLEPIRPIQHWADEHPLGCTGLKRLKRYSIGRRHACG